ncbi:alpha-amylase family protein [Ochrovirga pacifica]|uniref:alpha-amylase family protein n=1 Tax=Ochrovirga pacifica TaxID=1042376 RepID=UPI00025583A0|nr:alpha-amylase family protein [Ochrovirga pacifica]
MKKRILAIACLFTSCFFAQNVQKQAAHEIKDLEKLIEKAEKRGIDVLKEKTTIRTAEIFLEFADWDQKNIESNTKAFKLVASYKPKAATYAKELPDFERKEVLLMLEKAKEELSLVLSGKQFRTPSPQVDWKEVYVDGDQITYKDQPVFLADYTWKPKTSKLTAYHGNQDGFFITPPYVINEKGDLQPKKEQELKAKKEGSLGFIFFNHKSVPNWAKEKFGPNFSMREDTYTGYDIDNPGARVIQKALIKAVVPSTAGKKFSELGYMLCNEPHFYTQTDKTKNKKPWASGGVSHFTMDKFRDWLQEKHKNITSLNKVWKTNFKNFQTVELQIPIDISLKGTPKWYDWAAFNMDRVTDWYRFMKNEIQKYDPEGKVHLKIMPNLWTENARIHGIDLEALTEMSGIIGNDSGAEHKRIWQKKPYEWEEHYAFDWRELCMGFDFMKSVSPNKINFNSELHYLSTNRSRDLYMNPAYARATFWLAHTYGMTASQIWYWPRGANGAISKKAKNDKGYAGSNNMQPRVTNEVAMTLIDLNSFGREIMSLQRLRKPLRIFYSKTSAINKTRHMDDVFELYEGLHFNGTSLGFVTKDIINKQENTLWDVVLVHKTPFVTQEEFNALQAYLNQGGTIVLDSESLKYNEYGEAISTELKQEKGKLIKVANTLKMEQKAMDLLAEKDLLPSIQVTETNPLKVKTCVWKSIKKQDGKVVLSAVNVGKEPTQIHISMDGNLTPVCKDLIKGIAVTNKPTLAPNEVFFVEVDTKK